MHLATFLFDMHISWSEVEILLILVLAFTCIIDKSSEFMNKVLNIRVLHVKSVYSKVMSHSCNFCHVCKSSDWKPVSEILYL